MPETGLTARQRFVKRTFDVTVASIGLIIASPIMAVALVVATVDTREFGLFSQVRIGRDGQPFRMHKIRTMRTSSAITSTVTVDRDPRITRSGRIMRKLKVDELPQLANVLLGDMSIIGPRPDVPGFADQLSGPDRIILTVRPGITGPAAIAYRHEEEILAGVDDPAQFNRDVIWPDKVRINREYVTTYTFATDLRHLLVTVRSILSRSS